MICSRYPQVHSQTTTAKPSARGHVYETLLIDNLFLNYSLSKAYPLIRPATADGAVKVNLGYDSIVLKNVDDRTGEITLGYYESRVSNQLSHWLKLPNA